jgi:hypothetical protein
VSATYDAFVSESPQGTVFARSWWLDAAVGGGRWRTNILRGEDGAIAAAWPTVVRSTRFGKVLVGAPLTPALGPLLAADAGESGSAGHTARVEELVGALGEYAHIEARCAPAFDYWTPLHWHGFAQTGHYTWRIEDLSALDTVRAGLSTLRRRNLARAAREGVAVAAGTSDELVAMLDSTFTRQGIGHSVPSADLVRRLAAAAVANDAGELLAARDDQGRLHAAGLFVWDARTTWYLAGGADTGLRSSGAMTALMWAAIERASARGTAFDFEGSMLRHVEGFVRTFGARPVPYSIVRHTPSAAWRRTVAARRTARRLVSRPRRER